MASSDSGVICRMPRARFKKRCFLDWDTSPCQLCSRDIAAFEQAGDAEKLVVDERLQRTDVQCADGNRRVAIQLSDDGEERRFGFAAGGGAADQDMIRPVDDGVDGSGLYFAQRFPLVAIDIFLDEGRELVEGVTAHQIWKLA